MKNNNLCAESHISYYESDRSLSEYLEFHFGHTYFGIENFMQNIAQIGLAACQHLPRLTKALDLGCAVGRASFELSRKFDEVYGVDFSARFIDAATRLQKTGLIKYCVTTEGDLLDPREANLDKIPVTTEQAQRIRFLQGDACNLHSHLSKFDLVNMF